MKSTVDARLILLGDLQGDEPLRRSYDSAAIASTCDASTIVGYGTSDEGQEATIWMDGGSERHITSRTMASRCTA